MEPHVEVIEEKPQPVEQAEQAPHVPVVNGEPHVETVGGPTALEEAKSSPLSEALASSYMSGEQQQEFSDLKKDAELWRAFKEFVKTAME